MNDEKIATDTRRAAIADILKNKPVWDINKHQLAQEYGVSDPTIADDIKLILSAIPPSDLVEIKHNLKSLLREAIMVSRGLLRDNNPRLKSQGVGNTLACVRDYLNLLESMGDKPKAIDNVAVLSAPQIITFTHHTVGEDRIIEYCKSKGYTDVIEFYNKGQHEIAQKTEQDELARHGLLGTPMQSVTATDFKDAKDKGAPVSFNALRSFMKSDDEPVVSLVLEDDTMETISTGFKQEPVKVEPLKECVPCVDTHPKFYFPPLKKSDDDNLEECHA